MINKKLILKQLLRLSILLLTFKSVAQEVIGNIYSDSIPVQNVNILNKNSSKRTISDGDGKFVIKTTIGDTLIFSHVGMITEERRIEQLDSLKIHLIKRVTELDEVEVKNRKSRFSKPKSLKSIFGEIEVDKLDILLIIQRRRNSKLFLYWDR